MKSYKILKSLKFQINRENRLKNLGIFGQDTNNKTMKFFCPKKKKINQSLRLVLSLKNIGLPLLD